MEGFIPDEVQPQGIAGFVPDTEQPPVPEEPTFKEGSLGARVQTQLQSRLENVQESTDMMANDEQSYLEAAAQGFGQVLMGYNDVVSESVLELLSGMTPDAAEEWIKEQVDTGAEALMSTEVAQDLYQTYRSLEPRARKDVEAAANIGLSLLPMKSRVGEKLVEAGMKGEKNSLGRYLLDQSPVAKKARIAEEGMDPNTQTVRNRESSILNTALSIKGITASTPRNKMMTALNTEVARLGKDIRSALGKVQMTVPKGTVTSRLNKSLGEFVKNNPEYAGKDLRPLVEKVKRAYLASNKTYSGRPEELLEVRRKFDKVIDRFFGKDVHAGDHSSRPVVAHLRNELNQIMQDVAPDAQIRSAMQRQHHALSAKDNLAFNMALEKALGDKVISKLEHHPFLVGGALSGSGVAGNLMGSEAAGVGLGLLGAGYVATRPSVQKAAGSTLQTVNPTKSLFVDMLNQQGQDLQEEQ